MARLRGATRRLAEGDLSARVGSGERKRRDELEDLGRDFDGMAERMESMVSAQRRLLTDISHELRSPLARINVALGLLRQGGAKDTDGMLTRLETEAERLNRLRGDVPVRKPRARCADGARRYWMLPAAIAERELAKLE